MKKTIPHGGRKQQRPAAVRKATTSPLVKAGNHPGSSFPIVGLGASAGGLEALEQFLGHVPKACGLAFVVVQHLDPTRKGILVELLQRSTAMPVVQIRDRMKVEPDHVYVIPPNRDLSILHGVLHLMGLDHETDTGQMARAEKRWRTKLGLANGLIERVQA